MFAHAIPRYPKAVAWCDGGVLAAAAGVGGSCMGQFLGTHQNRLDAKGRVSIPAPFRTTLRAGAPDGAVSLVLRPSHKHPCIEGWPMPAFEALAQPLEKLDMFGEDHEDLSTALYADANPVESDKEGRILLPDALVRHAGLADMVMFMGLGRIFQIWEPGAAEQRRADARDRARARSLTLPGANGAVRA